MRMINDCLEISEVKRQALEAFDNRSRERELRIVKEPTRPSAYGNRKERRAAQAIERKKERA